MQLAVQDRNDNQFGVYLKGHSFLITALNYRITVDCVVDFMSITIKVEGILFFFG